MPADDICSKAQSSAYASMDPAFVGWATQVARRYCKPDRMGKPEAVAASPATDQPSALAPAPQAGCQLIINGWRPATCGNGPNLRLVR